MNKGFLFRFKRLFDSYLSVVPILLTVTVLFFTKAIPNLTPMNYVAFLLAGFFIGLGLALFSYGSDFSISKIGSLMGSSLFKSRKLFLIGSLTFLLGVIITLAEPDLKIMAVQTGFNETVLILVVSLGVGLFLLIGVLRILFKKNLQVMFLCFYAIIFALCGLLKPEFIPLAFDSGAVVTGPLTIPFILSFGASLALSRSEGQGHSGEDAFGLTALVTAGPIVSVMLLSFFYKDVKLTYVWDLSPLANADSWGGFWPLLGKLTGDYLLVEIKNLALAIVPLALFFLVYDLLFLKLNVKALLKILVGLLYAYLGMVIFLAAVMVGFLPLAQIVGFGLGAHEELYYLALILGGLFGLFGVLAEPAVHVLVKQIETVTEGTIKAKTILAVMALAIGGGMVLAVYRAHEGFSLLYYFIPIYALALALSFFVPKIYANIAFDSGSIASGPMAASFVMPFLTGYVYASKGAEAVYPYAFGTIAMVSAMPLVVIQLIGLSAEIKRRIIYQKIRQNFLEEDRNEVIHFY